MVPLRYLSGPVSQCLVMAYVTDTPSQQLDSYIILTLANVSQCSDSLSFHTSADMLKGTNACAS